MSQAEGGLRPRSVFEELPLRPGGEIRPPPPPEERPRGPGLLSVRRVEAVVNAASGSVGPGAAEDLEATLRGYGLEVNVRFERPKRIARAVREAVEAAPDLVVTLAGDGTAALAGNLCGPAGPLVAPLPGGTMNLLPHALYGPVDWREALSLTLERGEARAVSGGVVAGRTFFVAAILGSPALWADAREAVRMRRLGLALARARRALGRAFSRDLAFTLDGVGPERTQALMLLCPLISRALEENRALEAATLAPGDVAEAVRLGFHAVTGRWRDDPAVRTLACGAGRAWQRGRMPAVLDGEPARLPASVEFGFRRVAFRALAPPIEPPALSADQGRAEPEAPTPA